MPWWNDPTSKHAFNLAWISVIVEAGAAFAGLLYFSLTGSALCLVFGLENCVDFLSSVVVLWRFYCPGQVTKEREAILHKREARASMAISFILMLLGIAVVASAGDDLAKGAESEQNLKIVMVLALFSIIVFGALTTIKFRYSVKLDSASLYKDGVCSLIGMALAMGLFVTSFVIEKNPSIWWLDPVFAMACGFVAFFIGMHSVFVARFVEGVPIFSMNWWFVSQGAETDIMDGQDQQQVDYTINIDAKVEMTNPDTKLSEVV